MKRSRGICHVHIASRIRQQLHFIVNSAGKTIRTICQREVAMDERVPWGGIALFVREAAMFLRQRIAKPDQQRLRLRGRGGLSQSVMQMNFNFSPASMAELGQLL